MSKKEIKIWGARRSGTPCDNCKKIEFEVSEVNLLNYFMDKKMVCSVCGIKVDWWKLLLRHFKWEFKDYTYGLIGAINTGIQIQIDPNQVITIDLNAIGIPNAAKILNINYTPDNGGVFPLEIHGNSPTRHIIPHKIYLYGRPTKADPSTTLVNVSITWIDSEPESELYINFVTAIEAFVVNKFEEAIIPANVTVEAKLTKVMKEYLAKFASKENVKSFLNDAATYSHQLNLMLPILAKNEAFPELPTHIRGLLNSLRTHRNTIAHDGRLLKAVDKSNMAELMCASFFGYGYLNLLEKHLSR